MSAGAPPRKTVKGALCLVLGVLCLIGAFAIGHKSGALLGLTLEFWTGFLFGLSGVVLIAAIVLLVPQPRGGGTAGS